jgi:hypothetical protein
LLKERLGTTVIELRMPDEDLARQATGLLARRLSSAPERQDAVVRIASRDSARLVLDVLRLLDEHALTPRSVTVRESSLDDVFLALTRRRAEGTDAGADAEVPGSPVVGAP